MPIIRPHYEVYQDNMIHCLHGFPQFCADPIGNNTLNSVNGIPKIEIGDLGYLFEGRFYRLESLNIDAICGGRADISERYVYLAIPECGGSMERIDLEAGTSIGTGLVGLPSGGFSVNVRCERGEGALLNLETRRALFRYCEETTKVHLRNYMKTNYRSWLDKGYGDMLTAHELFLVTGTYMTKNWEAVTFVSNQSSFGGSLSVDAMSLATGEFRIDWRTCNSPNIGFNTGHSHIGQDLPDYNTVSSFRACCRCERTPENQCIFLRGWRIREMFRFVESRLLLPVSVESVQSVEWRRGQIVRKRRFITPKSFSKHLRSQGNERPQDESIIEKEEEGLPEEEGHSDVYDFVAIALYQQEKEDLIMIHDDDVIAFLKGRRLGKTFASKHPGATSRSSLLDDQDEEAEIKASSRHYLSATVDTIHTLAELGGSISELVPVSGIGPVAKIVLSILQICDDVSANKGQAEFLGRRCHMLVMVLQTAKDSEKKEEEGTYEKCKEQTLQLVKEIHTNTQQWSQLKWFDKILMRQEISDEITKYHGKIDVCLSILQLSSTEKTLEWQIEMDIRQQADHTEVMEGITAILKVDLSTAERVKKLLDDREQDREENRIRWQRLLDLLQEALQNTREQKDLGDLQNMLFNVITVTGKLPSQTILKGNGIEIRITDRHAVKNGEAYDVYKGKYLERMPVALKKLRAISVKGKDFHSRTWREVWEKDQGNHFLEYIGTVEDEGRNPYMVIPWQKNGNICDWIKENPSCDRIKLMQGLAEGVKVLHTWFPKAIVHGSIRAENVLISDTGNALLTDFSLAKVLESVGGVEITNSKGVSSYYRWTAPEVVFTNMFTMESDIFALGMTMLEIITGEKPFGNTLSNTQVVFKMQPPEKLRPNRPENVNDDLWKLINDCWAQEPKDRPNISEVLSRLEEIGKATKVI